MAESVEILAPTNLEKLKRIVGRTGRTSFVRKPSKAVRERIVLSWLSDLDSQQHRKKLLEVVDLIVGGSRGIPLVLIEAKTMKAPTYETLETLIRWAPQFAAYLAPNVDAVRRMIRARLEG